MTHTDIVTDTDVKTDFGTGIKAEVRAGIDAEIDDRVETDLKTDVETEVGTGTGTGAKTDIVYAYAVLRRTPEAARAVADLRGVAGEPIRLLEFGDDAPDGTSDGAPDEAHEAHEAQDGARDDAPDHPPALAAVVGTVPAAEFDEASVRAGLEDLDWLEATARGHHAVVASLTGRGIAVLPLRLVTVYRDEGRVRQTLENRRDDFLPLLDRVTGHVELGVKIYAAPDDESPDPEPAKGLGVGRAYLAGRRRRKRSTEDAWQAATDTAARLRELAGTLAVDRVAFRPQSGELAGSAPGPNVSNDAYLVPEDRVGDFRTRVLAAAEGLQGVHVEVTGPWAPYSFSLPAEPVS
ncbi:GvpL/GvpF family gas vesicle protein [Streptomyces sp. NBC_00286]|uniref:GvpL/GvpF family gas vesicle protein n=1 Tax=Streptomyces sp. NBC_00286 TaxID=2975701 RepID=UPI002E2CAC62|nr:GvpL/GvpF family gas vesicle protein [Streptomyces sp. NBC_00286]